MYSFFIFMQPLIKAEFKRDLIRFRFFSLGFIQQHNDLKVNTSLDHDDKRINDFSFSLLHMRVLVFSCSN